MTQKEYLDYVCDVWETSPTKYKKTMKYNYIILENGEDPVCWDDGYPVVYGSKGDCKEDIMEGDVIITEQKFFNDFLKSA